MFSSCACFHVHSMKNILIGYTEKEGQNQFVHSRNLTRSSFPLTKSSNENGSRPRSRLWAFAYDIRAPPQVKQHFFLSFKLYVEKESVIFSFYLIIVGVINAFYAYASMTLTHYLQCESQREIMCLRMRFVSSSDDYIYSFCNETCSCVQVSSKYIIA